MIGVLNIGLSNLSSITSALDFLGYRSTFVTNPEHLSHVDKILLPGVGSFNEAMNRLRQGKMDIALENAASHDTPILGICLGMQLLADTGFEGGETRGLGLIPGKVERLKPDNIKLPHMGWNSVHVNISSDVVTMDFDGLDFYFIHSYQFITTDEKYSVATTEHGDTFTSIVRNNNIYGFQFHPEKSQKAGLELLKSFLENA